MSRGPADRPGIHARDARVVAMLTDPDRYFAEASRRAWANARRDVEADVDRLAYRRRNGGGTDHET